MSTQFTNRQWRLPNNENKDKQSNYSMDFDGSSFIDLGDDDIFSFGDGSSDSPFSISAWIYMNDATKFRIVSKYVNANKEYVFATSSSDLLSFALYDNINGGRIQRKYNTALTSFEGQWIHVVGTYDGNSSSSGISIYLNGTKVDNADSNSGSYVAMQNTAQPFLIGSQDASYANGQIDEVAIFNRALNTTEIAALYGGTSPNIYPSNLMATDLNPIAYYPLGEQAQNSGYPSATGNEWQFPNGLLQDYVMDFDGSTDYI